MSNYFYSVFGLQIESELELSELQNGNGTPDVLIQFGNVPSVLSEPEFKGVRFETNENEFLLKIDDVADYYVTKNTITIQQKDHSDLDSVRVFLYGSAFAALLIQNGLLPLHANTLEKDGKAFLIAGDSGAGKSTLSTVLYKKGYNILSDDVSVLQIKDGTLKALPGIIYPKLWEKTLDQLGEEKADLKKIRPELNKYRFSKVENRFNEAHEIQKIFIINQGNNNEVKAEEVDAHQKLMVLLNHTFRKKIVQGKHTKSKQFMLFTQIAGKVDIWRIVRPKEYNTIDEIIELIESKL